MFAENRVFFQEFQKPVQCDWRGIYYLHACDVLVVLDLGLKAKYNLIDLKITSAGDTARNISDRNLLCDTYQNEKVKTEGKLYPKLSSVF